MSTTRHHINRSRRLATTPPRRSAPSPRPAPEARRTSTAPRRTRTPAPSRTSPHPRRAPLPLYLLSLLCLLTLLLGAFAGWARGQAGALGDAPAARNTALTDAARTSAVKGSADQAVNALFSYDHATPGAQQKAASTYLTGKAVAQHRALLAPVLAQAKKQKTVLTTTVTDSAVERVDGNRARVLVFADQSSTSTAAKPDKGTGADYAGAMLAVDLVERDGRWLVSAIDTFTT